MNTQYGVYHPTTGETIVVNTKEEAINVFYKSMIEFSKPFFHNTMYVTIQTNEDGSISYFNDGNEVDQVLSSEELESLFNQSAEINNT
jgi:hypothetical protein